MNDTCPTVTGGQPGPMRPPRAGRRSRGFAQKAAIAFVVVAASFVAVPAAHAADCSPGSYPPAQCTATVSATVVNQGGHLIVSGPGFAPGSSVSIDILSHVVHLRTVEADDDGDVRARVRIPDDFEEGTHTIMLTGHNPDGSERQLSATILIVESGQGAPSGDADNGEPHAEAGTLAHTGSTGTAAMGIAGGALLSAGGLTLTLVRRRRRTRAN